MSADRPDAPRLHVTEHGRERLCAPPARFIGRLIACDGEYVRMNEGRDAVVDIRVADLAPYLGGAAVAPRILSEAADHHDFVTIAVRTDRITYDNDAQFERARRETADPRS